jgi:hypothetical protein
MTITIPCYARKSAQLGNSPPAILAGNLLRELADEQKRRRPALI